MIVFITRHASAAPVGACRSLAPVSPGAFNGPATARHPAGENDATILLKPQPGSRRWQHLSAVPRAEAGLHADAVGGVVESNYTIILGSHRNSCLKIEKNGELCCMVRRGSVVHSQAVTWGVEARCSALLLLRTQSVSSTHLSRPHTFPRGACPPNPSCGSGSATTPDPSWSAGASPGVALSSAGRMLMPFQASRTLGSPRGTSTWRIAASKCFPPRSPCPAPPPR